MCRDLVGSGVQQGGLFEAIRKFGLGAVSEHCEAVLPGLVQEFPGNVPNIRQRMPFSFLHAI